LLSWFIERKSTLEVQELLKERFEIEISRQSVWRFSKSRKWKSIIQRGQDHLAKSLAKIPIANKENRLLYLQKVVEEGMKWSLKTITKDGDMIYELKLSSVTQAIKEAREEIEPRKPDVISGPTTVIYNVIQQIQSDFQKNRVPPLVLDSGDGVDKG